MSPVLGRTRAGPGAIVYATDYGADASGKTDSTAALQKAMAALLSFGRSGAGRKMAANITDLGGATLDLAGGEYLTSAPLVFPPFVGNAQILRGTLRASKDFPRDQWLVMIGNTSCEPLLPSGKPDGQNSCNEFINLAGMLFDAAHVAAGGVYVAKAMGTTIGPSAFFTGFNQVGVKVDAGHEVMIQQAWFAEYYWSEEKVDTNKSKSIGIQINGNDHYLTDVIVFDFTRTGVEVNGAANILQNVHTWNGGGIGIAVNSYQTRVLGCYLDFNKLIIRNPSQTVVESTFFLSTNALLKADQAWSIDGLRFRGNTYATDGPSIELEGNFTASHSLDISDEISGGAILKLSRARRTLHQVNARIWAFDFSDVLLFPTIDEIVYSFVSDDDAGFVRHVARKPQGTKVIVETDVAATGTVTIDVRQGTSPKKCMGLCSDSGNVAFGPQALWL
eukprot:TRINITY_DN5797_c0_g2_i1.p1 TRINITY_DN5797_c0_g2~~TRINITY_DN5797_c0_g2_i1.p1  ORF type:complete len:496 (-),score=73.70 TRINITY_DN5797_c0_g2_i1:41-1381(-)